jgi:hypothetical protein
MRKQRQTASFKIENTEISRREPLVMFGLQPLLGLFRPVKAVEPRIAVFAPEGVQEDKSQQWLQEDPVRTPHSIIALTFWAIRHHGSSVPRAVPLG